jgi:hypothetical protein
MKWGGGTRTPPITRSCRCFSTLPACHVPARGTASRPRWRIPECVPEEWCPKSRVLECPCLCKSDPGDPRDSSPTPPALRPVSLLLPEAAHLPRRNAMGTTKGTKLTKFQTACKRPDPSCMYPDPFSPCLDFRGVSQVSLSPLLPFQIQRYLAHLPETSSVTTLICHDAHFESGLPAGFPLPSCRALWSSLNGQRKRSVSVKGPSPSKKALQRSA